MQPRAIFILGAILSGTLTQAQDCVRINPGPCSLLNQARVIFVATVIEDKKNSVTHKFRVTEAFKGVTSDSIDVAEGLSHLHYQLGEEYLVFADPCWWESPDSGCLTSMACSNTRELKYAAALSNNCEQKRPVSVSPQFTELLCVRCRATWRLG